MRAFWAAVVACAGLVWSEVAGATILIETYTGTVALDLSAEFTGTDLAGSAFSAKFTYDLAAGVPVDSGPAFQHLFFTEAVQASITINGRETRLPPVCEASMLARVEPVYLALSAAYPCDGSGELLVQLNDLSRQPSQDAPFSATGTSGFGYATIPRYDLNLRLAPTSVTLVEASNVMVSVPEPSTWELLLLGLVGIMTVNCRVLHS